MKSIVLVLMMLLGSLSAVAEEMSCESSELYESRLDLPNGDSVFYSPRIIDPSGMILYLDKDGSSMNGVCQAVFGFQRAITSASVQSDSVYRFYVDREGNIFLRSANPGGFIVSSITCSNR